MMLLSTDMLPDLLLQRTGYQGAIGRFLHRAGFDYTRAPWLFKALENLRLMHISGRYERDLENDYNALSASLPEQALHILDIGCGLGGIDVFLNRHYDGRPHFTLLDKNARSEKVYYGFRPEAASYNALDLSVRFLTSNGLRPTQINPCDISRKPFPAAQEFDLIVSLLSWGFHYPVDTYLQQAYRVLKPGGVLILDSRKGTNGVAEIETLFGTQTRIVMETDKFQRIAARK